eukprot:1527629-Ditylum_brightwellii.AAC.1
MLSPVLFLPFLLWWYFFLKNFITYIRFCHSTSGTASHQPHPTTCLNYRSVLQSILLIFSNCFSPNPTRLCNPCYDSSPGPAHHDSSSVTSEYRPPPAPDPVSPPSPHISPGLAHHDGHSVLPHFCPPSAPGPACSPTHNKSSITFDAQFSSGLKGYINDVIGLNTGLDMTLLSYRHPPDPDPSTQFTHSDNCPSSTQPCSQLCCANMSRNSHAR